MTRLGSRRRWWLALAVTVLLGAPAAFAALTTITFTGTISLVSGNVTAGGIEVGDPFEILVAYEATETTGSGTESVDSGNNSGFGFTLDIDGDLIQSAADDLFGSPVLTLDNGAFSALQFTSTDYNDLGPTAYTNLALAGPLGAPSGVLEILDSGTNARLVVGDLTGASVSPD